MTALIIVFAGRGWPYEILCLALALSGT